MRDALRLRQWALRVLLSDQAAQPPAADAAAWSLFLRAERCAAAVQAALGTVGTRLAPAAARAVNDAAVQEARRALSARAHLRTISDIAAAHGWDVIALKGCAELLAGRSVLVMDVDVLAPPAQAHALAAALDAGGFTPAQRDGPLHLQPRTSPDSLYIEVHVAVTGFESPDAVPWGATRPVPDHARLRVLAPQHHAWVVLCQAVRKHADRRFRIRDLLMLRHALAECTPEERQELLALVDADRDAPLHRAVLDRVAASADDDATRLAAARYYLFLTRQRWGHAGSMTGTLHRIAAVMAAAGVWPEIRRRLGRRQRSRLEYARGLAFALVAGALAAALTVDAGAIARQIASSGCD